MYGNQSKIGRVSDALGVSRPSSVDGRIISRSGLQATNVSLTQAASKATSSIRKKNPAVVKSFSTHVCPDTNNNPTCSDSNCSCKPIFLTNIPDASKSRTSDQDSTSSAQDFYEYWDSSRQDLYRQLLWLPKKGTQGWILRKPYDQKRG